MRPEDLEKILEIVDEYKKYACLEYGWNLSLWDRNYSENGYSSTLKSSGAKMRIRR